MTTRHGILGTEPRRNLPKLRKSFMQLAATLKVPSLNSNMMKLGYSISNIEWHEEHGVGVERNKLDPPVRPRENDGFSMFKFDMAAHEQFVGHQETLKTFLVAEMGDNARHKHQKSDTGFTDYTAGQILDFLNADYGELTESDIFFYKTELQRFDTSQSWSTNLSRWKETIDALKSHKYEVMDLDSMTYLRDAVKKIACLHEQLMFYDNFTPPIDRSYTTMTAFLTARNIADTSVAAAGYHSLPPATAASAVFPHNMEASIVALTARLAAIETANAMAAAQKSRRRPGGAAAAAPAPTAAVLPATAPPTAPPVNNCSQCRTSGQQILWRKCTVHNSRAPY